MYVWLEFFTRVRPDSTIANPACMNMTRNPVTRVQTKLTAILFCPTWLATSGRVTPALESAAGTSLIVPVIEPPGSPLARSAVWGAFPGGAFCLGWRGVGGGRGAVHCEAGDAGARDRV